MAALMTPSVPGNFLELQVGRQAIGRMCAFQFFKCNSGPSLYEH